MGKQKKSKKVGVAVLAAMIGTGGIILPIENKAIVQAEEPAGTIAPMNAEQVASAFMTAVTNEKWEEAYALLNENFKQHVSKDMLPIIWEAKAVPFGKVGKQLSIKRETNSIHTNVVMTYEGSMSPMDVTINLDKAGNIDDFYMPFYYTPPSEYKEPSYERKDNYVERQMKIGEGGFALPGTLTLPKGEGPFPAVILVHGSGPNDQDEALYSTKAFRDIAVGLANEGIAVLRYEKVTREHHIKTAMNMKFSIYEETIDDALKAVNLLHSLPEVSDEVYVLGHSQGGYALPRILEMDHENQIDGGIIVSGPSGKFQDVMLWQQQEALKRAETQGLPAEQLEALRANLDFWQQQMALINNPVYSKDNIPEELQLPNAYWWYELRDYVPSQLAAEQDDPLLIMQGGKDLQVPPTYLEEWESALKTRDNVSYKMYPDLIHLLVNYEGAPNFSEYAIPANVPETFIQDTANWIKGVKDSPSFSDVDTDFWAYKEIMFSAEKGYLNGYSDGKFQPNRAITRAQAAKIVANALQFEKDSITDQTVFTDIQSNNEFLPYIRFLKQKDIMSGYKDGTFKPNEPLTRAQMARLLSTAFQLEGHSAKSFKDVRKDHWAAHYIDALATNNITVGNSNGTFGPTQHVTRAQTAAFLYRAINQRN
ncbi:S-layer homology domain-containing protein [Domibacillus aminovorans]|uniref:SLH domain-containing protein n=1 Tax=Domibacillus aminovorans TaxID=29332 RepID=A0A177L4R5_9BACI|nr:S-layer homology domain-containing protein [Domibacillus aminovorans]OAH60454.1 hypothetical protein AWH49_16470 [Domibacillus aminovorans]